MPLRLIKYKNVLFSKQIDAYHKSICSQLEKNKI